MHGACSPSLTLSLSLITDIDQLITISGMVIRTSQLIPEMQEAFFRCQVCAFTTRVEVDRGRIAEPAVCRNCNTTHSLALVHNRSAFSDKQMVRVAPGGGCRVFERSCQQMLCQSIKTQISVTKGTRL